MKEIFFDFYDLFNELALLHNHKDMNIDIQKATDMFAAMYPRHIRMTNFF